MAGEIGGDAEEAAAAYIAGARHQARRRLHRGLHRAARQDDGARRRDRLRLARHRAGQGRRARGGRRDRRAHADRGRRDRRADARGRATVPDTISFARGAPSLDIIDVDSLREAAARAFASDPGGATAYGTAVGYVPLRRWIAERMGVLETQVMVTNGSMQADAFLFDELVAPGDAVVVERPSYDRTLLGLRTRGARIAAIAIEPDGIDVDALARGARGRAAAAARPHHPQLPQPRRLHAVARQAHAAARAGARALVHDLRGRPLHRAALPRRAPADDVLDGRRRGQRRLRVVVLEDRLPGHPHRLHRRARRSWSRASSCAPRTPTSRRA